jgi:hypothetical protein
MEGSNRVCLLLRPAWLDGEKGAGSSSAVREIRKFWIACPAEGNPAVVRKNGCQLEIGSG